MSHQTYPYPITVLMPAFNAEKYLKEAIDSILSQTFTDFEFLIIDDGSTDHTVKIVSEYDDPRIKLVLNKKNEGLVYTLNKGLDIAQGKYIARMDADDIALPNRLSKQYDYMEQSGIDVISCAFSLMGTPHEIHFPTDNDGIKVRFLECSSIVHPGVLMRLDSLQKHKLQYNSDYKHAEDYQLWTKCAERGLQFGNLDEVLLIYRQHTDQVSTINSRTQELLQNRIQNEYLSFYFKDHISDQQLCSINQLNGGDLIDKTVLLNKLCQINKKYVFFPPSLFQSYLLRLLYKYNGNKSFIVSDILKLLNNNVSFIFIATIIKIRIKKILYKNKR